MKQVDPCLVLLDDRVGAQFALADGVDVLAGHLDCAGRDRRWRKGQVRCEVVKRLGLLGRQLNLNRYRLVRVWLERVLFHPGEVHGHARPFSLFSVDLDPPTERLNELLND